MKLIQFFTTVGIAIGFAFNLTAQTWTTNGGPYAEWFSIASSADGSKLVAVSIMPGYIYTSTNSGATWAQTIAASTNWWVGVASSADGTKLAAVTRPGPIYTSTNSGLTWTSNNAPDIDWYFIASSADGTKLVAAGDTRPISSQSDFIGVIFTSADSGKTWVSNSLPVTPRYWYSVASSADGNKLVVLAQYGQICTSTNAGATWRQMVNAPGLIWARVACSADGTRLAAVSQLQAPAIGGSIYTSSDSGVTWISNNAPYLTWFSIASSADGINLVASAYTGPPTFGGTYVSTNAGTTWVPSPIQPPAFLTLASSADGKKLAGVFGGGIEAGSGNIYTAYSAPNPSLNVQSSATNLVVSWTVPSTNLVLQQNSDLTTTNWSVVTNPPVLNLTNLQNQVALPVIGSSSFFRLKAP